jgi:hypothetical protein
VCVCVSLSLNFLSFSFSLSLVLPVACNFILLGSTKIVSVLLIYFDAFTGLPSRLVGNGLKKTFDDNSPPNVLGKGLSIYGEILGSIRGFVESADTFIGRCLYVWPHLLYVCPSALLSRFFFSSLSLLCIQK